MSQDLSNEATPLSKNPFGTPADGDVLVHRMVSDYSGLPHNMTVDSQVTVGPIKYVDAFEFDGARGGDTRTKAAPAVLPNQPGPREPMGQSADNSKLEALKASTPTLSSTEGSEGERA